MADLTPEQERAAAQTRASVWDDGKRRVTVAKFTRFRSGYQMIVLRPDKVIDDSAMIELLEANNIELVDLDVNGRPQLSKKQRAASEAERNARIDALAGALDVPAPALRAAIDKGGAGAIETIKNALAETFTRDLRARLSEAEARIAEQQAEMAAYAAAPSAPPPAPPPSETPPATGGPSADELAGNK